MHVCIDDGGTPRVIGWTSADTRERLLEVSRCTSAPVQPSDQIHPVATIERVAFETRVADLPSGESARVIVLREGDDPAVLPDWRPCQEHPATVLARHRRGAMPDIELIAVTTAEFSGIVHRDAMHRRGRPEWWTDNGLGGVSVWPEPSEEWEIIHDRARLVFDMALGSPAAFVERFMGVEVLPWQREALVQMGQRESRYNFISNPVRDNYWRRMFLYWRRMFLDRDPRPNRFWEQTFAAPPVIPIERRPAVTNRTALAREIIAAQVRNGGEAPGSVRVGPDGFIDLAAEFLMLPDSLDRLMVLGVPIVCDPLVPPGQMYVVGIDPAAINAGDGYTWLPFGRVSHVDPETTVRARERARALLKGMLSPPQWEEFQRSGSVTERIDGCEYRLRPGGMIEATKPKLLGTINESWCVNPDPYANGNPWMPEEDKLIGQLLHLRAGPDALRAMANVYR